MMLHNLHEQWLLNLRETPVIIVDGNCEKAELEEKYKNLAKTLLTDYAK